MEVSIVSKVRATRTSQRIVLKRGVSEVCRHVAVLSGSETQLAEAIRSVIGTRYPWWWSLQPFIDEFSANPELKLYFDTSDLMMAAFAQRLRRPLPIRT